MKNSQLLHFTSISIYFLKQIHFSSLLDITKHNGQFIGKKRRKLRPKENDDHLPTPPKQEIMIKAILLLFNK